MEVKQLVAQIQFLQKQTNDAIVKKQTAISRKKTIEDDLKELENKSLQQFGCYPKDLQNKKLQLQNIIVSKINKLKQLLGVE